jgi:hypothetical protein
LSWESRWLASDICLSCTFVSSSSLSFSATRLWSCPLCSAEFSSDTFRMLAGQRVDNYLRYPVPVPCQRKMWKDNMSFTWLRSPVLLFFPKSVRHLPPKEPWWIAYQEARRSSSPHPTIKMLMVITCEYTVHKYGQVRVPYLHIYLTLILTSDGFYQICISWVPYMTPTPPPPHWLMATKCGAETILCRSGSDFQKVSAPEPKPAPAPTTAWACWVDTI